MVRFFLGLHAETILKHLDKRQDLALVLDHRKNAGNLAAQDPRLLALARIGKLPVLNRPGLDALMRLIRFMSGNIASGYLVHATPIVNEDESYYSGLSKHLQAFIHTIASGVQSSLILAERTRRNVYRNLAAAVYHPSGDFFKNRYCGVPGMLISAGPSLAKNIDTVCSMRERAVMVCVGTVAKRLQEHGLTPHFTATLDFHEMSAAYLADLEDYSGVLVSIPGAAYDAVTAWQGRKAFTGDPSLVPYAKPLRCNRSILRTGGTVAHLGFSWLVHIGCNPIVFVGQDLSYTGAETHFENAGLETGAEYLKRLVPPPGSRRIGPNLWEFNGQQFVPKLREVEDIYGKTTFTDMHMASYRTVFEQMIGDSGRHCVNATEGGILKGGCEILPLKEAAQRYCRKTVKEKNLRGQLQKHFRRAPTVDELLAIIDERREELTGLQARYESALPSIRTADALASAYQDTSEIDAEIRAMWPPRDVSKWGVMQLDRLAQRAAMRRDRILLDSLGMTKDESRRARAGGNLDYTSARIECAETLVGFLDEAEQIVEQIEPEEIGALWLG